MTVGSQEFRVLFSSLPVSDYNLPKLRGRYMIKKHEGGHKNNKIKHPAITVVVVFFGFQA